MRALRLAAVLAATMAVVVPQAASAAPGDLDSSWDGDGIREDNNGEGNDVAIDPNGKVVVGSGTPDAIRRYNDNGTPDTTFDGDGEVDIDFEDLAAIAVQSDGKIVAVGSDGGNLWVARFNVDGSPDTGFDGDGETVVDFGGNDSGRAVTFASGGRIVVAGSVNGQDFAVARLTSTGAPDGSFDTDGEQTIDFGTNFERATGVVVQPSGRTVVFGASDGDFVLAGLTEGGGLDGGFGTGGKRTTDFGGFEHAFGLALDSQNRIVAVGDTEEKFFAVARYDANGTLDSSCDGDGKLTFDFTVGFNVARDVAVQFNDRIVVAGTTQGNNIAIARLEPADCSFDSSFGGGDGKVTTPGAPATDGVAIQPADGKIVASAYTFGEPGDYVIARYLGDTPPQPQPQPQPDPDPQPQPDPQPDPCANDRTGPSLSVSSLQNKALYQRGESPASVRIEASDPSGLSSDPSTPSQAIPTDTTGVKTVTVSARDRCNNETVTNLRYRVAAPPAIQVAGVSASCRTSNFVVTIRIRGDVDTRRVTARLRGRLLGKGSGSRLTVRVPARTLRAGRYTIVVAARDRAGNRSTTRVSFARCVVVEPTFTG